MSRRDDIPRCVWCGDSFTEEYPLVMRDDERWHQMCIDHQHKQQGERPEIAWLDKHGIGYFGRSIVYGAETANGIGEFYIRFDIGTKHYPVVNEELMAEWLRLGDKIFGEDI